MDNTIIQQGSFTSTGENVTLKLRSDVDWIQVYNISEAAADQTVAIGVKYYWQRGFRQNSMWATLKSDAADAANLEEYIYVTNPYLGSAGFSLVDTSNQFNGLLVSTITAISTATPPVVTISAALDQPSVGSTVRLFNIAGAQQFGGMDFTVGYNTSTGFTFSLDYAPTLTIAGTTGSYRVIPTDGGFYPRARYITKITQASEAVITLSVTHGYQVGQSVRIIVPEVFGMVEINGIEATIVAIDTTTTTGNTITVNVDSTNFTPFVFPSSYQVPFTPAEIVPIGEDTATALDLNVNILSDAVEDEGYIGIILTGGPGQPAGYIGDNMFWIAGKSFSVTNNYVD